MGDRIEEQLSRPSWHEAVIWTGCSFPGLLRLLSDNGFRLPLGAIVPCGLDLSFGLLHSMLQGVQTLCYGHRVKNMPLPDDPIFVIGHWRTGTTLMHELLALDPHNRCPTSFECFAPQHFLLTERWLRPWIDFAMRKSRPMDNMSMGWDRPQEDEFALCNLGVPTPYWHVAFPNNPRRYQRFLQLDVSEAELERWKTQFTAFLKRLLVRREGRLVLKSPSHTARIPVLLDLFPNARFIHLVRNPYEVFKSTVWLWKSLFYSQGYQYPNFDGIDEYVLTTFAEMDARFEATRDLIPGDHFVEVRYEKLVQSPKKELARVYEVLQLGGFGQFDDKLQDYLTQNSNYQTNRYELDDETCDLVASRWRSYLERYSYSSAHV